MHRSRWAAAIAGAALGVAFALVPLPAHAAPTATAWVTSFAINYEAGSSQVNSITSEKVINSLGTWWQFTDVVPITAGTGCHHPFRGATLVWCSAGSAWVIGIFALDLNDTITVKSPNTFVYGGAGNDVIYTPADPSMSTVVYGEAGTDTIVSGAAWDTIDGGSGQDTVSYANRSQGICADLGFGWGGPYVDICTLDSHEDTYESIENLTGGSGDDELWGSDSTANRIDGAGGDDELHGLGGDDVILGGPGNDFAWFSYGSDVVYGQDGDDILYGDGLQFDILDGGNGYDKCQEGWIERYCEA